MPDERKKAVMKSEWNPDEWVPSIRGTPQRKSYIFNLQAEIGDQAKVIPDDPYGQFLLFLDQALKTVRIKTRRPFVKVIDPPQYPDRYIARPLKFDPEVFPMFELPVWADATEIDEIDWINMDKEQQDNWLALTRPNLLLAKWIWFIQAPIFAVTKS